MEDASKAESWLPVLGYKGLYEVSDHGRVRSLDRMAGLNRPRVVKGRVLRPGYTTKHRNRAFVNLCRDGEIESKRVAILVLEAFVSPRPSGAVGCHNNGQPWDDRVENLRWDTQSENIKERRVHGTDPEVNRETCRHDHVMAEPNLVRNALRAGRRRCKACTLARRSGPAGSPQFVAAANEYYRLILEGRYSEGHCRRSHRVDGANAGTRGSGGTYCRACRAALSAANRDRVETGVRWPEARIAALADERFTELMGDPAQPPEA